MRKISQQELKRMQSQGGVKVRRRLGTKKPESETKDTEALSGAKRSEVAVPTPALLPVMEKVANVLERLESRDGSKKSNGVLAAAKEEKEQERQLTIRIQKVVASAIAALPKSKNIQAVVFPKKAKKEWIHTVVLANGLIKEVHSKSNSGQEYVHNFQRNNQSRVKSITTQQMT